MDHPYCSCRLTRVRSCFGNDSSCAATALLTELQVHTAGGTKEMASPGLSYLWAISFGLSLLVWHAVRRPVDEHHSPCSKHGLSFIVMALITSDCGVRRASPPPSRPASPPPKVSAAALSVRQIWTVLRLCGANHLGLRGIEGRVPIARLAGLLSDESTVSVFELTASAVSASIVDVANIDYHQW